METAHMTRGGIAMVTAPARHRALAMAVMLLVLSAIDRANRFNKELVLTCACECEENRFCGATFQVGRRGASKIAGPIGTNGTWVVVVIAESSKKWILSRLLLGIKHVEYPQQKPCHFNQIFCQSFSNIPDLVYLYLPNNNTGWFIPASAAQESKQWMEVTAAVTCCLNKNKKPAQTVAEKTTRWQRGVKRCC